MLVANTTLCFVGAKRERATRGVYVGQVLQRTVTRQLHGVTWRRSGVQFDHVKDFGLLLSWRYSNAYPTGLLRNASSAKLS